MRKILYALFTIFIAISLIFIVIRLIPGDPISRILGENATAEEILQYQKELGLDQSIFKQYLTFWKRFILKGDLGKSLFNKEPIGSLILNYLPATLSLAIIAILISGTWGIFLGISAALFKQKGIDNILRVCSLIVLAFPVFSLAPILVYLFSIKLNILPVSGWDSLNHMILPVLSLSLPLTAVIMKMTRSKYLEVIHDSWITVIYAKGFGKMGATFRLAKLILPSILNIIGIQLSVVLAGAMVSETIFDIPGMGLLLMDAIQNRDYPIVQGVIIYTTLSYMIVYFLIEYLNGFLDPRIKK